jgi:hypothetical protein
MIKRFIFVILAPLVGILQLILTLFALPYWVIKGKSIWKHKYNEKLLIFHFEVLLND